MGDDSGKTSAVNIALLVLFFIGATVAMYITYMRAAPLKYNSLDRETDYSRDSVVSNVDDNHDAEDPFLSTNGNGNGMFAGGNHQYGTL